MTKGVRAALAAITASCLLFSNSTYAIEDTSKQLKWNEALNNLYTNSSVLKEQSVDLLHAKEAEKRANLTADNVDIEKMEDELTETLRKEMRKFIPGYNGSFHFSNEEEIGLKNQKEVLPKVQALQTAMTLDGRMITQQSLKIQLNQFYYELIQAQEELKQKELYKEYVNTVYEQSKLRKEKGLISQIQLEQIELQKLQGETSYNSGVRNLENARMKLNMFMAQPLDTEYEAVDDFFAKSPAQRNLEEDIANALQERMEFKQIRRTMEINQIQMDILEPYMFKSSHQYDDMKEDYDDLVWENTKLQNQLEQQEYLVTQDVKDGYRELYDLYEAMGTIKNEIQKAKNDWSLEKTKVEAGMSIETELLPKRNAWLQKELELIQAEADYVIAYTKYLAAIDAGPAYQ